MRRTDGTVSSNPEIRSIRATVPFEYLLGAPVRALVYLVDHDMHPMHDMATYSMANGQWLNG